MRCDLHVFGRRVGLLTGVVCSLGLFPGSSTVSTVNALQYGVQSQHRSQQVDSNALRGNAGQEPARVEQASYQPQLTKMSRRLNNVNWQQFEDRIVDLWGDQLQASAEDEQGTRVRIILPGDLQSSNQMVIDRDHNTVTFEGGAKAGDAWNGLVELIDTAVGFNEGSIHLVGMRKAESATIHNAAHLLGIMEDPSTSLVEAIRRSPLVATARFASGLTQAQERQNPLSAIPFRAAGSQSTTESQTAMPSIPQAGATQSAAPSRLASSIRSMPLQQDQVQRPQIVEVPQEEGLGGTVRIRVVDELGTIFLFGDPEDVRKVRDVIENIIATADTAQPAVELRLLENVDSDAMKEMVDEIYQSVYQANNGPVVITARQSPNSLLVVGQPGAQDIVLELIQKLDVAAPDSDDQMDFRVFSLEHMSAVDMAIRLRGYFSNTSGESYQVDPDNWIATVEGPIHIISDYRSNTLIVKGNTGVLRTAEQLISELDVSETATKHVVRIFQIRNTLAADLAVVLQAAINGQLEGAPQPFVTGDQATQAQQAQTQFGTQGQIARQPVMALELTTIEGGQQTTRSGILFDVRISADNNSNQIIVTGPPNSMDLIAELVNQLDRIPEAETLIKVFTMVNGDATEILTTLQAIFGQGTATQGFTQTGQSGSQLPLQTASASEGASLINLRFGVETRSNSIIASGPSGDLQVVEDLLYRLDQEDLTNRINTIYRLRNAPAEDVAIAITDWLTQRADVFANDPTSSNPYETARRQVIVVPEFVGNNLIISATPAYYDELIRLIQDLDRRPAMVKIKVLLAAVSLGKLTEFGVEVGIQDSLLFDRGIGNVGFPFNQTGIGSLGNNSDALALGTRELFAGQALSNLSIGRQNSDLGYGGLVLTAGNESINVLVRALEDKSILRVLSTPEITTLDNLQGRVQVGEQVPRIQGASQNASGGITSNVADVSVGTILEITPRVSPDGMIIMNVDAVRSQVGPLSEGIPVFTSGEQVILSPRIEIVQAQSTIMARSGQTVVVSGLIQDSVNNIKRGTPILSDLPVIGPLFAFESDDHDREELIIILTPYLIDNEEQQEISNHTTMDRMNWCLSDVAEIYGPVGYGQLDPENLSQTVPATYYPDHDPTGEYPSYVPLEYNGDGIQFDQGNPGSTAPMRAFEPSSAPPVPRSVPGNAAGIDAVPPVPDPQLPQQIIPPQPPAIPGNGDVTSRGMPQPLAPATESTNRRPEYVGQTPQSMPDASNAQSLVPAEPVMPRYAPDT
ncbi:MAG: secretin N-terminal domain-containing protein, partial [Pirellulaceae bacterium]